MLQCSKLHNTSPIAGFHICQTYRSNSVQDEDAKLDKEQESLPDILQENIAGPASEETSLPTTSIAAATGRE